MPECPVPGAPAGNRINANGGMSGSAPRQDSGRLMRMVHSAAGNIHRLQVKWNAGFRISPRKIELQRVLSRNDDPSAAVSILESGGQRVLLRRSLMLTGYGLGPIRKCAVSAMIIKPMIFALR